jgi:uncharacterized protein (TIGR04255 family)
MNWEPARADHSIERATASIVLLAPLSPDTFDELVVAARKAAARRELTNRYDTMDTLEFSPPAPGGVINFQVPSAPPRRIAFQRLDPSSRAAIDELSVGQLRLAVGTTRYRSWGDLLDLMATGMSALNEVGALTAGAELIRSVHLDYIDVFEAAQGSDYFEVIDKRSRLIPSKLTEKTAGLHSHAGWFDYESDYVRRLTNINVDVHEPVAGRQKITFLSVARIEAVQGGVDQPIDRLTDLHGHLQSIFRATITKEAADRVGLNN